MARHRGTRTGRALPLLLLGHGHACASTHTHTFCCFFFSSSPNPPPRRLTIVAQPWRSPGGWAHRPPVFGGCERLWHHAITSSRFAETILWRSGKFQPHSQDGARVHSPTLTQFSFVSQPSAVFTHARFHPERAARQKGKTIKRVEDLLGRKTRYHRRQGLIQEKGESWFCSRKIYMRYVNVSDIYSRTKHRKPTSGSVPVCLWD